MSDITRITSAAGDDSILGPLVKQLNRGAMVAWINHDLINRAGCDIRKSIVLYDADMSFVMALPAGEMTPALFEQRMADKPKTVTAMHDRLGIRYWSQGLV
jgi:hypothetical protein